MKHTKNLILLSAVGSLFFLSNCGTEEVTKKEKEIDEELVEEEEEEVEEEEKSPFTPEENKAAIQDIAVDFVSEMKLLEASKASQAAINLALKFKGDDDDYEEVPIDEGARKAIKQISQSTAAFSQGKISGKQFALAAIGEDGDDDDEFDSFQSFFDENKGVYDWDEDTEDFEITTEGGNVVSLRFPSDESSTTNDAIFTIRSYEGKVINDNPVSDDYIGELPTKLVADLTIDGIKEMEYSVTAAYNAVGEPTQLDTKLFMNPFTLSASLTNTTTRVATSINLSRDAKVIIGSSVSFDGNFTEDNIRDAEDDESIGDVVTDASMTFTLLNLKIEGSVMVDDLEDAVIGLDTYYEAGYDDASVKAEVIANEPKIETALNAHTKFKMKYADSGAKAADMEWYTFIEKEDEGMEYEEVWVNYGIRMTFEDGSKVDFVDFVETGMGELESSINSFIDQFAASTGEDLEHIDLSDLD